MTTSTAHRRRMTPASGKSGFTLVELLVVIGMIALIMGAISTSMSTAMQRSRIQKATAEVRMLAQAIQSYANYNKGELTEITSWQEADFEPGKGNLSYLGGENDANVPVLIQAALQRGTFMRDPWGSPYMVKIVKGNISVKSIADNLETGFYMPNFYRLTEDERK